VVAADVHLAGGSIEHDQSMLTGESLPIKAGADVDRYAGPRPPDSNSLPSVFDHCLRTRNYVNIVTCGKQPQLQWLNMDEALEHCSCGGVNTGTTTTPFDMVVLNEMSRFRLALDALKHIPRLRVQAAVAIQMFGRKLHESEVGCRFRHSKQAQDRSRHSDSRVLSASAAQQPSTSLSPALTRHTG
jgi:hypothetical protein